MAEAIVLTAPQRMALMTMESKAKQTTALDIFNELKSKGLSQEQFGNEAGLDRSYIGGVERGSRNISLVNIGKVASALDLTIETLFEGFHG